MPVLLLANHIGDQQVLEETLSIASLAAGREPASGRTTIMNA
ncbi:DUF2783 domain-containing protein [Litchfieldella rifensis]|uniref:DUF2783 domain-containing protein n=1 Tax=Litchfieldella rifensis TaxID=762643 RepID=A0ABV7LLJ0_9GAMM